MISFNHFAGCGVGQMFILGLRYRLGGFDERRVLWARTAIGQYFEVGKLWLYTLVGNAAYPCRPWMLAPFKGNKDDLSREEYHWNFVQSSI